MATTDPAGPLLEMFSAEVQRVVQALRPLVADVFPDLHEKVQLGWKVIQYLPDTKTRHMLVVIAPHTSHVNLEFGDGVDLPDPNGRLEGTGKRARHVKIRTLAQVNDPDVRALLEAQAQARRL